MKKLLCCLLIVALTALSGTAALAARMVLPASLRTVDEYAFYGDRSIREVIVPDGAKTISSKAFASSGLQRIVIPDSVTDIAGDAFDGTSGLTIVSSPSAYARQYASAHSGIAWESAAGTASISPDAPLTRENILALLDEIDPDGAYIIRNSRESSALFWFHSAETIGEGLDSLETAVHEQCHDYCGTPGGFLYSKIQGKYLAGSEWIYIGNGQHIEVFLTDVFPSSEMVDTVPETLRTDRFDTYVAGEDAMASVQYGPYGLLDEFTAYCWGMHDTIMQDGYRQENDLVNRWSSNGFISYAEFRYYILHYMLYAKQHYPDVYNGILNNDSFRRAFASIDNQFAGYAEKKKNRFYIDQWDALMTEMEKTEYVEMAKLLKR